MGNSEEPKPTKSDKPSSPADQTNVHVYPDWAAMQAYYGPRVAMPPYYNSAMAASGHPPPPPPYMWNPQHMMSPYGTHYATVYPHGGGVYAHPGIHMGSQPQGQKGQPLTSPGTHMSIDDTPTKSTGNTDNGLMKKLKEFDGLAMSLGNGNAENNADGHKRSHNSSEMEGSTDASDGNTTGADEPKLKRSREGTPTKDGKHLVQSCSFRSVSPSSGDNGVQPVQGAGAIVSPGNERELKRERRKQSNRESARRSRLRKQAETEELARKVEALTAENMALRSELNQLNEKSDKLRGANATLLDKLKSSEPENRVTENMLSRVKNSGTGDKNKNQGDNDSNSNNKLHQLLDTKPRRGGAVAAG
ncbi:G-box-binding factor 3 isoform X2 [Eutrema salsugineum]|nr:G-box-binding factor 3 isoform X2 [Eutrema salsugineum]